MDEISASQSSPIGRKPEHHVGSVDPLNGVP